MSNPEWLNAMNEALNEGIQNLRNDITNFPPNHNPAKTVWDLVETFIQLAQEDPKQTGIMAALAMHRLATAECRRDQEPCH